MTSKTKISKIDRETDREDVESAWNSREKSNGFVFHDELNKWLRSPGRALPSKKAKPLF